MCRAETSRGRPSNLTVKLGLMRHLSGEVAEDLADVELGAVPVPLRRFGPDKTIMPDLMDEFSVR